MTKALLVSLGCCASILTLPMGAAAQSFDCRKASTATEKMICADPEISTLDLQLAEKYKVLLSADAQNRNGVIAVQARWLIETRNVAARAAALKQAYKDRIEVLGFAAECATGSDAMTQMDMNSCESIAFDNSDAELAALYRKLLAQPEVRSDKEAAAILKVSQDAWLKFRDAQCEWESVDSRGGTIHSMIVSGCARILTNERVKQLTPAK